MTVNICTPNNMTVIDTTYLLNVKVTRILSSKTNFDHKKDPLRASKDLFGPSVALFSMLLPETNFTVSAHVAK